MPPIIRLGMACATALFAAAGPAVAGYYDPAAWFGALAARPDTVLVSVPGYSYVEEDAFGRYAPATVAVAGRWSGRFSCSPAVNPCLGAYRATYTLPFEIVALAGRLRYGFGYHGRPTLSFFDPPPPRLSGFDDFQGFYGDVFAPTDTITVTWRDGLLNTDSASFFLLTEAVVVRAAPIAVTEPATIALLGTGALLLAGVVARRR